MSLGSLSVTADAQTFQWPFTDDNRAALGQDYAQYNRVASNQQLHTGLDIGKPEGTTVCAAADGKVVMIQENGGTLRPSPTAPCHEPVGSGTSNCADHGYGNTVIIEHDAGSGTKIYSQYSHLASIDGDLKQACGELNAENRRLCSPVVDVDAGCPGGDDKIGEVGCTRYSESACGSSFGSHLHFEIKEFPTLGTSGNDKGKFGYTPDIPDAYGYNDPILHLHTTVANFGPTALTVTDCPSRVVLRGPGTVYASFLSRVQVGQQFVAFNKSGDWYQIHLPASFSGHDAADGWINTSCVTETSSVDQLKVRNTGDGGVYVRPDPAKAGTPLAKVWDGQRLVTFGTPTTGDGCLPPYQWHQIHVPGSGATTGWICDEWVQLVAGPPPPSSSPSVSPVTLQGQAVPGIAGGEFSGFGGSRLNNNGDVIFGAGVDTNDDGLSNVSGFFKESQGTKTKIVATGEPTVTSIGTLNFLDVNAYGPINDDGDMVFQGVWDEVDGGHNGNFLASNPSITKLFESGEQITVRRGTGTFHDVRAGPINNQGDIAFTASVVVNNFAASHIFLAPSGCRHPSCLVEIAAAGEATGVNGVGGTFDSGGLIGTHLSLTADGDVIFRALINGGLTSVAYVLFDRDTGTRKKIVAAGDVAPSGRIFNGVSSEHVAPNGRMVFLGKFPDASPTSSGQLQGVYYISSVSAPFPFLSMKKVVEEGDQLPGANDTLTLFSTGTTRASVNSDGSVAFSGKFFPVGSPLEKIDGVFIWTGGKFVQIVLEGECTPAGGAYGGASDPHLNDSGKVVFFNPRVGPANGCPAFAAGTSSSQLSGWSGLAALILPATAHAQEAGSNIGVFAAVSPLDPEPDPFPVPLECLLDVDMSGTAEVSTDVVYIARHLLGLDPVPPSFRTIDPGIPPSVDIAGQIDAVTLALDVDSNGQVEVSTDVVYIARHLLGVPPLVPPSFRTLDPTIPPDLDIVTFIDALCL